MSGGLPYGLQSMLKVRETTRRDETDERWMMDGWMTRWGRDEDDDRWLEGERGTGRGGRRSGRGCVDARGEGRRRVNERDVVDDEMRIDPTFDRTRARERERPTDRLTDAIRFDSMGTGGA